jgi:hypothetical protein
MRRLENVSQKNEQKTARRNLHQVSFSLVAETSEEKCARKISDLDSAWRPLRSRMRKSARRWLSMGKEDEFCMILLPRFRAFCQDPATRFVGWSLSQVRPPASFVSVNWKIQDPRWHWSPADPAFHGALEDIPGMPRDERGGEAGTWTARASNC